MCVSIYIYIKYRNITYYIILPKMLNINNMPTSNNILYIIDKQRVFFTFIISYILLQVLKKEYTHL